MRASWVGLHVCAGMTETGLETWGKRAFRRHTTGHHQSGPWGMGQEGAQLACDGGYYWGSSTLGHGTRDGAQEDLVHGTRGCLCSRGLVCM